MQHQKSIFVGIAGGSGSGKSWLAQTLKERLFPTECTIIEQDAYYRDLSHLSMDQRARINFDHPEAVDFQKLTDDIHLLKNGKWIDSPEYDFVEHLRKETSKRTYPAEVILLEGLLILVPETLRAIMDLRVFVHTPERLRLSRRIERDVKERGRSEDSVRAQFKELVLPAHHEFVEPSQHYADIVVSGEATSEDEMKKIVSAIQDLLLKRSTG